MSGRGKKGPLGSRFGIGEWFGYQFAELSASDRRQFIELTKVRGRQNRPPCPFKPCIDGSPQPCTKQSGVCSLQLYSREPVKGVERAAGNHGKFRCTCPVRFGEGGIVQRWIAEELLGTSDPLIVGEVPFLRPDAASGWAEEQAEAAAQEDEAGSVGRIDNVLIHPDLAHLNWCAVEMQAVYFSGPALSDDFSIFIDPNTVGIPFPTKIRRPDYRSSGPKRLMPQLQIKVPTLRRWGKKMAVVIDEAFYASLGRMDTVSDPSNSDIAWFVVDFEQGEKVTKLVPRFVRYTTLERAVEGLTAGLPLTLGQFEDEIKLRLNRK